LQFIAMLVHARLRKSEVSVSALGAPGLAPTGRASPTRREAIANGVCNTADPVGWRCSSHLVIGTGQYANVTGLVVRSSRINSLLMTHNLEGRFHCAAVFEGFALELKACSRVTLGIYIGDCAAVI